MQNGIVRRRLSRRGRLKGGHGLPQAHELDYIESVSMAGRAGQQLWAVARAARPELPVRACGLIGTDGYGDELLRRLGYTRTSTRPCCCAKGRPRFRT